MTRQISHFIAGTLEPGASPRQGEVFDPNSGALQAAVAFAAKAEVNAAVKAAKSALPEWAALNPQRRARVMFRFKQLLEDNMEQLAQLLSKEHGKTIADSKGEIQRGMEVVEFACGVPHLAKGEYTNTAGTGIDMYSMRLPVGVCVGITPFNFPAMIPMWMFAPAIACGNTFICKPSEKDPSLPVRLAELFCEAGAPAGVFNVLHGDKECVDLLLTHADVAAVSFVGSSNIAEYVYATAAANGKRVQAMGGAKNHMIIMPDADMERVVDDLIGAGYGSAGERCMAIAVAVPVGEETAEHLMEKLVPRVEGLRVGPSQDPQSDYGPLITAQHREKVKGYIDMGLKEGASLAVDGRDFRLQGYEDGFFLGASLFDHVTAEMQSYKEEIFGPVLQVARAPNFEQAIALPTSHDYGNGAAVYTRDGDTAREFAAKVGVGMVGVNVPIPVPLAYYSFGGWKRSAFGDMNQHGMDGIRFYTKLKTVTSRWPSGVKEGASFVIPTMK